MESDKILLNISDLNDLSEYKKLGISNFLFPLKDFCIGYPSFSFDEIKNVDGNTYVLINRLLTDSDIDAFLNLNIPNNIKGFIIEDVGLFEELKKKHYELINFQNHLNNNYKTINYWLNHYDSLVISTDITRDEIKKIVEEAMKPLVLNTFGYPMIMYSRRRLVTNFYHHLDEEPKNNIVISERVSNSSFFLRESEYGTAVFNNKFIDYREIINEIDDRNIKFYLVNTAYTSLDVIKKVIDGEKIDGVNNVFLDKKTIYRVGDAK